MLFVIIKDRTFIFMSIPRNFVCLECRKKKKASYIPHYTFLVLMEFCFCFYLSRRKSKECCKQSFHFLQKITLITKVCFLFQMAEPKPPPPQKLTKKLYTDITRLKLLDTPDENVRFRVTKTPFNDNEEDIGSKEREEYFITGLIFPKSSPYNERCYEIEIKLTKTFPVEPPEVRFLTSIYHPNVARDGELIFSI